MSEPYRVYIVVDTLFGERLTSITELGPVWIVDSHENRKAAELYWEAVPHPSHSLDGITIFSDYAGQSPEDRLLSQLSMIDLHHGRYAAHRPYSVLTVIGVGISDRIRTELAAFDLTLLQEAELGFIASMAN